MDLGLRALEAVYERMRVDPSWCIREERGFTWWPGALKQRIWVEEGLDDEGIVIYRLHARTDFAKEYDPEGPRADAPGLLMGYSTVNGLIQDPADASRLPYAASMYVHEGTIGWVPWYFAWVAAIQVTEGHINAEMLERILGLQPDGSEHPVHGHRRSYHAVADIIDSDVRVAAGEPSRYAGQELAGLVPSWQRPPTIMVSGNEAGVTMEFPFHAGTSLVQFDAQARNPRMGNGLIALLKLPLKENTTALALRLNALELTELTRAPFTGSWCKGPDAMTFVSFLPNVLHLEHGITNLAHAFCNRARWVAEEHYGDDWEASFPVAFNNKQATLMKLAGEALDRAEEKGGTSARKSLFEELLGRK